MRGEKKQANKYYKQSMDEIEDQLGLQKRDGGIPIIGGSATDRPMRTCLLEAQASSGGLKFADLVLLYGILLKEPSRYSDSLACFKVAHETFCKNLTPFSLRIGEVLYQIGSIFSQMEQYEEASIVLQEALSLRRRAFHDSSRQVVETARLLGICESKLGHIETSMKLLEPSARAVARKKSAKWSVQRDYEEINTLFVVGNLHYQQGKVGTALDFYNRCLKLYQSIKGEDSRRSMLEVTIAVGNAFLKGGSHFRALMSFEQALCSAEGMESAFLICDSLSSMVSMYASSCYSLHYLNTCFIHHLFSHPTGKPLWRARPL